MTKHYRNYFWQNGIPYGIDQVLCPADVSESYKIVMDPYRKYISIEKYFKGHFESVIYDSTLLNFKKLKNENHLAWQKTIIEESAEKTICHLRDQDDRLVFKETYLFKNDLCYECTLRSAHDILISTQRMFYKIAKNPYNGVILFDQNNRPVLFKQYEFDEVLREFTNLIEVNWNMQHFKA